jgi:hypothetical protein
MKSITRTLFVEFGIRRFDFPSPTSYADFVKNSSNAKRIATPEEVVRLAKKMKWRDIHLPNGDVVTAETTQRIFADAAKALKSRRKRAHAARTIADSKNGAQHAGG